MEKALISIIVPVYNAVDYLHQCLQGIQRQTFRNFEVILVDDGSTDGSAEICDAFCREDKRFRVIHKKNEGVSASRNRGLDEAVGEWVCFIDRDDSILEDYLDNFNLSAIGSRNVLPMQGIFHQHVHRKSKCYPITFQQEKIFSVRSWQDLLTEQVLENGYVFSKLFRREIIERNGIRFNTSLSIHEDHIFVWSYLQEVEEVYVIPKVSYIYLKKDELSLSSRQHSSEEWIYVSQQLQQCFHELQCRLKLPEGEELNHIRHEFGLNQLMRAAYRMNVADYPVCVAELFRCKEDLLLHFEPRKLRHRIFLYFLEKDCPAVYFYIFSRLLYCFRGNVK